MAESIEIPVDELSSLSLQDESDSLISYLEEKYHTPSAAWWEEVDIAFQRLKDILERRPSEKSDEEGDAEGQKVRANALPRVKLFSSTSHALKLTAINEELPCVAFGTISTELYVDTFWEQVAQHQGESDEDKIVVYNIDSSSIQFNFRRHNFILLYVPCEKLVRRFPGILDVPDEVLGEFDEHTQSVVGALRRDTQKREHIKELYQRTSYHYLRACATSQGRYTANTRLAFAPQTFNFQGLLKLMDQKDLSSLSLMNQKVPAFELSKLVSNIFPNFDRRVILGSPHPARGSPTRFGSDELLKDLQEAETGTMHSKLQMRTYIQVNLRYYGTSPSACGKWLSIVEERLSKLKFSLESKKSKPDAVCIWPQRLLDLEHNDLQDNHGYWAGCYILGLRDWEEPYQNYRIANPWKTRLQRDAETRQGTYQISIKCMSANDFDASNLVTCPRQWPRPVIPLDQEKYQLLKQDDSLGQAKQASKHQKNNGHVNNGNNDQQEPLRGLRPAKDVLNRLRFDPSINMDEYKVGYTDRHTEKIQEKPAADWVRETTDELFIPEHRIVWFKRCPAGGGEVLVWDRASRIDRIFTDSGVFEESTV